jgi:hypothetical protein
MFNVILKGVVRAEYILTELEGDTPPGRWVLSLEFPKMHLRPKKSKYVFLLLLLLLPREISTWHSPPFLLGTHI